MKVWNPSTHLLAKEALDITCGHVTCGCGFALRTNRFPFLRLVVHFH
eukprot:COSAG05_NODE_2091_length_3578_cov_2.905145_5_plen_47_part_00